MILELKGKLPSLAGLASNGAAPVAGNIKAEAMEALMGLGFSNAEAQAALSKIPRIALCHWKSR
ncbi:hypothetical protein KDK_42620 [Dictyobacter kobayashii]|uniref:Holliday junction DNA helicase RuvA C-terminal domain-containing protein n=1 Tax=Dictyobacter kobayashii TaxID=2014872 RepID=A0A402AN01_9CHLR|nr:hypothetical protein KDK_42620 [Dictyobacter kobayashii]